MKSLFRSKTFYFGLLQIAYGVTSGDWNLVLTGVGSIGLRTVTNSPVSVLPRE